MHPSCRLRVKNVLRDGDSSLSTLVQTSFSDLWLEHFRLRVDETPFMRMVGIHAQARTVWADVARLPYLASLWVLPSCSLSSLGRVWRGWPWRRLGGGLKWRGRARCGRIWARRGHDVRVVRAPL